MNTASTNISVVPGRGPDDVRGSSYIELLPVGPGATRRIQQPGFAYNNARWLPDAKRLVVRAREQNQLPRLYELNLDDGSMRAFTPEGVGISWSLSPDGRRVAAAAASGIEVHSIGGDQDPQKVPAVSGPQVVVGWVDRGLLVYDGPDPFALGKVLLIDPVTGARQTWREILPPDPRHHEHGRPGRDARRRVLRVLVDSRGERSLSGQRPELILMP